MLDLNPLEHIPKPSDLKSAAQKGLAALQSRRRQTLRHKVQQSQGKAKINFFDRNLQDTRRILETTNQTDKLRLVNRLSVVCFAVGAVLSLLMGNILMLPVLSVGFSLVPMWYIRYNETYFKKQLSNELEVALSVVTTSYLRTDNLLQAVEENLSYINHPVRTPFARFVNEVKYINANVETAIRNLQKSIENSVFHDWCDIMVLCAADRTYKQSLPPVVEKFADDKALQNSLETIIQMPVREFNKIILLALSVIPLFYMVNKDWFHTLVGTWGGKAILTVMCGVIFAGMNKAIGLSTPVE